MLVSIYRASLETSPRNLQEFFSHKTATIHCLSKYSAIMKPTAKSDFFKCLAGVKDKEGEQTERWNPPIVEGCVIVDSALVRMSPPRQ